MINESNEGCYNCENKEEYNGCRNLSMRYLCSPCVQGHAKACEDTFKAVEASLKVNRPVQRRFRRTPVIKGDTLATAVFLKGGH